MLIRSKSTTCIVRDASVALRTISLVFREVNLPYTNNDLIIALDYLLQKSLNDWGYVVKNKPMYDKNVCQVIANAHIVVPTLIDEIAELVSGLEMFGDSNVEYEHIAGNLLVITKKRASHESRSYSHSRRSRPCPRD